MKKLLSLLLAAVLIAGVVPAASADEPAFSDSVEAQSFAVAMALYDGGFPEDITPANDDFLWTATGWYAAWLYRTEHIDLLEDAQIRDFQRSLGVRDAAPMSVELLESIYGARLLRSSGGSMGYDFQKQKSRADELLGVAVEFLLDASEPYEATATVRQHYALNAVSDRRYLLRYTRNRDAGSAFPYSLQNVKTEDLRPVMDPALDFDWDGLLAANSLKNILSLCDCVRIQNNVEGSLPIRIFRHDGKLCILRGEGDYIEGEYRGCWFRYEPGEDGKLRPRISGFDAACGDEKSRDDYISNYLYGAAIVDLDRIDGDLIRTHITYTGDWNEDVAIDRGVLFLREMRSQVDEDTAPVVLSFRYDETPPAAEYLDSWNKPLRHVNLIWEDWYSGGPHIRRETIAVPADWEYLPWEARWGDYTIYMNEGYTQPYTYPGDGVDYTLWLTTAKG